MYKPAKRFRFFFYLLVMTLLSGCGPDISNYRECKSKSRELMNQHYEYTLYKNSTLHEERVAYDFYIKLKKTNIAMRNFLNNTTNSRNEIPYEYINCVNLESEGREVSSTLDYLKQKKYKEEVEKELESLRKDDLLIDATIDETLNDYRKKAVKRHVANGAGNVMVETFVFKNGETTTCKITVTDSGRALDCSH